MQTLQSFAYLVQIPMFYTDRRGMFWFTEFWELYCYRISAIRRLHV